MTIENVAYWITAALFIALLTIIGYQFHETYGLRSMIGFYFIVIMLKLEKIEGKQ